jgi:hypothetical protein
MKAQKCLPILQTLSFLSLPVASHSQVAFQNLDFEAAFPAILPTSPAGDYTVTTAFPGWTVYYGGPPDGSIAQSQTTYQLVSTGETFVGLVGANGPAGFSAITGRYSALLQGGVTASDASIRQTGMIPVATESIQFEAYTQSASGPLLLSLGGQNIPYQALASGPNYILYGANISAFAGQTEALEFSALEEPGANNNWEIDSIIFSPNTVPEPQTWSLLLLSAATLALKRRRHKT